MFLNSACYFFAYRMFYKQLVGIRMFEYFNNCNKVFIAGPYKATNCHVVTLTVALTKWFTCGEGHGQTLTICSLYEIWRVCLPFANHFSVFLTILDYAYDSCFQMKQ